MKLAIHPRHLKRYKDIAMLLIKHGRSDLVHTAGLESALEDEDPSPLKGPGSAEQLADDLERMGPTFIKVGQVLSTRPDLIPYPYIEALTRLQDKVDPFPYDEAERIVHRELGVRISKAFQRFDEEPVASASLGQVHYAVLRSGEEVAVKVQRPDIKRTILDDLDALEEIASFFDEHTPLGRKYAFSPMLDEFRRSLIREMDYRLEAANLQTIRENLSGYPDIVMPEPHEDLTTARVLTMTWIEGTKIDELSPVIRTEIDGLELADQVFRAYLQQILVDGLFHADPHPGNVLLTRDHKIALIDLGMVGHMMPSMRDKLLKMVLAISRKEGERVASIAMSIGLIRDDFNEQEFKRRLNEMVVQSRKTNLEHLQVGRIILEICRTAGNNGITVPPELTLLGKTLLNLDQIGRTLSPDFDPNASVRRHAADLLTQKAWRDAGPGNILAATLEVKEFVQELPQRVNRLFDMLTENRFRLDVDVIDEQELVRSFQKVANRITMGLILAAVIVGAALMMNVETEWKLFGYPGIAIIFFLAAAFAGLWLVFSILWHDRSSRFRGGKLRK